MHRFLEIYWSSCNWWFLFLQDGCLVITKATGIADSLMSVALIYNMKTYGSSLLIILGLPFLLLYKKL